MVFPERFSDLPEYAFPRLRTLLDGLTPGGTPVALTIGEPQHDFPDFITEEITKHAADFRRYPPNEGLPVLREAIAGWIKRRYDINVEYAKHISILNGTREGLYNAAMALCPETKNGERPVILTPNPFYQAYSVGAMSVNAEPIYVPATAETGHLPDFVNLPEDLLRRTTLVYICSPANPQGATADADYWRDLLALAEKYDFQILADECYCEVYRDAPPMGALQAAKQFGAHPERVAVFHSLSKRSNLAGLRSGFVCGGPETIARIQQMRTYAGAPLPIPLQHAAAAAWNDETHVTASRALYQAKFDAADEIFAGVEGYQSPRAGFFLWLPVPDGVEATVKLWTETGVRVLPGEYLSRDDMNDQNPGQGYIRIAMVAPIEEMRRALTTLRDCIYT